MFKSSTVMKRTFGCSCAIVTPAINSRHTVADAERIDSRNLANAALAVPMSFMFTPSENASMVFTTSGVGNQG